MNQTEFELRGQALQAALATSHQEESSEAILARARDYYQFIAGKSPGHIQRLSA